MFWDKKESAKSLPDLPPMKFTPPIVDNSTLSHHEDDVEDEGVPLEKHGLPSFPDSPMQRGFSQSAIKDAVTHEGAEESVSQPLQATPEKIKTVEVDEWSPQQSMLSSQPIPPPPLSPFREKTPMVMRSPAVEMQPDAPTIMPRISKSQKNTDIFVKIDKFYSAKKALETTNHKLDEIDSVLHKIRETKMREEQELAAWEKDLATVKARIKEVTDTIFEKVE